MTFARLFKVLIKENLSLKRLFGFAPKDNKVKAFLIGLAILYAVGAMFFGFGYLFFDLGAVLAAADKLEILLSFIYTYAVGMSALMILLRANGYLFQYKDYSVLGPLPIKPRVIMAVKMAIMLIVLYLPSLIITLPITVIYFYYAGIDVLSLAMFLILFMIIPLVPVSLVSFLSYLIARVTARARHRNIINIILMFSIVIGFMVYSFSSSGDPDVNPLTGQVTAIEGMAAVYWPMAWFANSVHNHAWLDFAFLTLSHLILFGAFVFVVGRLAVKTNQQGGVIVTAKNNPHYKVIEQGVYKTLIGKEFRKFIGVPLYAMNSGIGVVLMLILAIVSLFYQNALGEFLPMLATEGFGGTMVIVIYVGFCVAMTFTPAISLSLEGKNLWVLKSLPLPSSRIMWSKITFNLLLAVPASLIAILLFSLSLKINVWETALLLPWAVSFGFAISVFDAILNLLFPKIQFINEVEVIKQSIAALFAVFGGFFFVALNAVGYFFLTPIAGSLVALGAAVVLNGALGGLMALFVHKNADRYIRKL